MNNPHLTVSASQLAAEIASDLFINANGDLAQRLALLDSSGSDLGGWFYENAVNRIEKIIKDHTTPGEEATSRLRSPIPIEQLASFITNSVFTSPSGQQADRIVLIDEEGRDFGDWSRRWIMKGIENVLMENINTGEQPPSAPRLVRLLNGSWIDPDIVKAIYPGVETPGLNIKMVDGTCHHVAFASHDAAQAFADELAAKCLKR